METALEIFKIKLFLDFIESLLPILAFVVIMGVLPAYIRIRNYVKRIK